MAHIAAAFVSKITHLEIWLYMSSKSKTVTKLPVNFYVSKHRQTASTTRMPDLLRIDRLAAQYVFMSFCLMYQAQAAKIIAPFFLLISNIQCGQFPPVLKIPKLKHIILK